MKLNGRVDESGWKGFEEKEGTRSIEPGQTATFALPLNYHPFDVELSETSGSLTRSYGETTYSGRRSDSYPSQRTVPVLYENGDQVYVEVQENVLDHYTWDELTTEYFTTTTPL